MRIEHIYVICCKADLRFTQVCVASVRQWYPDIKITLVKDQFHGVFSTRDLERFWNVSVFPSQRNFGSCIAKMQPLLRSERETYLMLDADIAFVGPVLTAFDNLNADFVVVPQYRQQDAEFSQMFFEPDRLKEIDADYTYPGFAFNAGQMVQTSGLVTYKDLEGLIEWNTDKPFVVRPDIFKLSEQGLTNYLLTKKQSRGELTIGTAPFMIWGGLPDVERIPVPRIPDPHAPPLLIHWGGGRATRSLFRKMYGGKILGFYESLYYSRVPFGGVKRAASYVRLGVSAARRRVNRIVARAS